MKKVFLCVSLLTMLVCGAFTFLTSHEWQISSGYSVKFSGKYADGTFEKLTGTIFFEPTDPSKSRFDVTVDVASINTGKELKNKHAKSEKWFDAEKYPIIHFISSEINQTDSTYVVTGELELHGVKKEISIPFTFQHDDGKASFHGIFKVDRGAFGIGKSTGKDSDFTTVEVLVPVISK